MGVAWRRYRGLAAVGRRVWIRRLTDVGRCVGEPEEERLRLRGPAVDEVHGLTSQHVLLEGGGVLAVPDQGAILVERIAVDLLVRGPAYHSDHPRGTGGR